MKISIFKLVKNHQPKTGGIKNATLRVVLEHTQNSTSDSDHSSQTSGILMFKNLRIC